MDLKTRPCSIDMEKKDLKKLTKGQLIKLLLKQKKSNKVSNHKDLLDNYPFGVCNSRIYQRFKDARFHL